jgi:hypothetical protein
MSATTANSPSEYGTPGFFSNGPQPESIPASNFSAPNGMPFLSPMVDPSNFNGIPPSVSPLSAISHGDPVIANQSPPLSSLGRSHSADLYAMQQDPHMGEDMSLNEMYAKQHISLPFRSPLGDDNQDGLDMNNLVSFDMDPSSMSPENAAMFDNKMFEQKL